jgi:DNA-binding CsgD family transcriptional regulator
MAQKLTTSETGRVLERSRETVLAYERKAG